MIGKIKKGSGFKGCVNYVLGKEQAALLHAEGVLAESSRHIIRSFCMQTEMNPGLKKPVGHIALSYSAVNVPKLTDEKMIQLAQEYMREMKITDTQYIIVRHQDREHPHVHIVFNRIDTNGKTISDKNDYTAVKNEIGKSRNWQQLQRQLAEKGIGIQFKYKGQTDEVQGISFSKGEYTFKGSEIDRNFSYYKLDKYFGDAGLTTTGSNRQSVGESIREPVAMPGKADNSFVTGLGGLFSASSSPADEIPDNLDLRKKKKKKKRQFKL